MNDVDKAKFLEVFDQIFTMQHELNTVPRINRDTINAPQDIKDGWIFQYAYAINEELSELDDSEDEYNSQIEVIDILHFVVSLCQLVNITPKDIFNYDSDGYDVELDMLAVTLLQNNSNDVTVKLCDCCDCRSCDIKNYFDDVDIIRDMWKYLTVINRSLDWKWWSKSVINNPSRQFVVVVNRDDIIDSAYWLFVSTIELAYQNGLDLDDILNVYKKKHAVNIKRQENDYDVRYKTEADNLAIIDELKTCK